VAACRSTQDAVTSANNVAPLPGGGPADTYRVRATETSFYHISPLQPSGPDEQLKKGTEVTVVKSTRTYTQVKVQGGNTGYVATEDIAPLTAQEIAAANTSSIQAQLESQRQAAARSMGGSGYTIPPEAGSEEKLPEQDAGAAGPKVNTRASASPTPNPIFHQ
jgi:hypothetical protein